MADSKWTVRGKTLPVGEHLHYDTSRSIRNISHRAQSQTCQHSSGVRMTSMRTSEDQGKGTRAHSLLHLRNRTIAVNVTIILFFHWLCLCAGSVISLSRSELVNSCALPEWIFKSSMMLLHAEIYKPISTNAICRTHVHRP